MNNRFTLILLAGLLLIGSCKNEPKSEATFIEIRARLAADPDRLNPMLSASGYATEVYKLTHFPLLEYHPITLELEPVIAIGLPVETPIDTGILAGGTAYTYEIRPEATWDDGTPITAADYVFTLKAALNPLTKANAWRGVLSFIHDVVIDPVNPRRFSVLTIERYFLALPATGNMNLYPAHIYDPHGLLADIPLRLLANPDSSEALAASDPRLAEFAALFTSDPYSRDTAMVQGAGPYRLARWDAGQEIVLERKTSWWGDKLNGVNDQFIAKPNRIRYKIIADEQAAITLLQDGGLDVVGELTPAAFTAIQADSVDQSGFDTHLPVFMQYYYLGLNNHNPKLADLQVRRALAHCLDLDLGIQSILHGLGQRIIGPFHPSKAYYNRKISPVPFDPSKARQLLVDAGWTDTNGNGTVDKKMNGKVVELHLTLLLAAGSEVGQNIGLLLQQGARQAGIEVALETKDFKLILGDMGKGNYDLAALRNRQSPADDDPYQYFHSDSDTPGGSNRVGYRSPVADSLILAIRNSPDQATRYRLYQQFQEVIAADQPVIFLYSPMEPVISRKSVRGMVPSPMRPGYYLPFLYL